MKQIAHMLLLIGAWTSLMTAQPPAPTTAELKTQIENLSAQLDLLKKQAELQGLASTLATAKVTQMEAQVKAETALAKADAELAKTYIPAFPGGVEGKITSDGASTKSIIAAWNKISAIASEIAGQTKLAAGRSCVVTFGGADLKNAESAGVYTAALESFVFELDRVKGLPKPELLGGPPPIGIQPSFAPMLIGPSIEALIALTKLFRTDRTIVTSEVKPSDDGVQSVVASALTKEGCQVYDTDRFLAIPSDFYQKSKQSSTGLFKKVQTLLDRLSIAEASLQTHRERFDKLSAEQKKNVAVTSFIKQWEDAVGGAKKALEPVLGPLAISNDAGFMKLLRGESVRLLMEDGAIALQVKVESAGATRVTTKKALRGDAQYAGGGAVVTYRGINKSGKVVVAGQIGQHSEFEKIPIPD